MVVDGLVIEILCLILNIRYGDFVALKYNFNNGRGGAFD